MYNSLSCIRVVYKIMAESILSWVDMEVGGSGRSWEGGNIIKISSIKNLSIYGGHQDV